MKMLKDVGEWLGLRNNPATEIIKDDLEYIRTKHHEDVVKKYSNGPNIGALLS